MFAVRLQRTFLKFAKKERYFSLNRFYKMSNQVEDPIETFRSVKQLAENISERGTKIGYVPYIPNIFDVMVDEREKEEEYPVNYNPEEDAYHDKENRYKTEEERKELAQERKMQYEAEVKQKAEAKLFAELTSIFQRKFKSTYSLHGVTDIEDYERSYIEFKDKEKTEYVPLKSFTIDQIKKYFVEAPFGDLQIQTTVLDKDFRNALECKDFSIVTSSIGASPAEGNTFESELINEEELIEKLEVFFGSKGLTIEQYKMNIYGKGQFFKPHVDTPIDPKRMIGTLVLCFPIEHTGGDFKVIGEQITNYNMVAPLKDASGNMMRNKLSYVAFHSDTLHEVEPVTDGTRLTITYNVLLPEEEKEEEEEWVENGSFKTFTKAQMEEISKKKMEDYFSKWGDFIPAHQKQSVAAILEKKRKEQPNQEEQPVAKVQKKENTELAEETSVLIHSLPYEKIGILLSHEYTFSAIEVGALKGKDKQIFEFLRKMSNFDIELIPVALNFFSSRPSEHGGDEYTFSYDVYSFNEDDLKFLRAQSFNPNNSFENNPFLLVNHLGTEIKKQYAAGGLMGNWSENESDARVYVNAAIVISKKRILPA